MPAAAVLIRPVPWEPPYAVGGALEKTKDKKKKKKKKKRKEKKKKIKPKEKRKT